MKTTDAGGWNSAVDDGMITTGLVIFRDSRCFASMGSDRDPPTVFRRWNNELVSRDAAVQHTSVDAKKRQFYNTNHTVIS